MKAFVDFRFLQKDTTALLAIFIITMQTSKIKTVVSSLAIVRPPIENLKNFSKKSIVHTSEIIFHIFQ